MPTATVQEEERKVEEDNDTVVYINVTANFW
jgi:hypothetical protein